MTKILAIDTSGFVCSVALSVDTRIYDRVVTVPSGHTKVVLSLIDEVLAQGRLDFFEIDFLAFGQGPGSFTGVRLASSIVQGIAFAVKIPVIGISTLQILAQCIFEELGFPRIVVAIDARMQEVYLGKYILDDGIMRAIVPDQLIKPQEVSSDYCKGFVGVGDGFDVCDEILVKKTSLRIIEKKHVQAKYMLKLAEFFFAKGTVLKAKDALPVYLREKVVLQ